MAKKPKPKTKPLSATLTGQSPKTRPMKRNRPKGSSFLGAKPGLGTGISAPEVARASGQAGTADARTQFAALAPAFRQLTDQQLSQVQRFAGGLDNQYTRDARGQVSRSFGAADRVRNVGNQTVAAGQRAGRQITNLAPVAQRQANQAAGNINRQGNQITRIADQYGNRLTNQAGAANREADAAAGRINPLGRQVVGIGDRAMNQIGGLGSMLANQARRGFATSGPTTIEAEMYRQGEEELALGRSLSPEQLREATQGARQGMAARGMATGSAGLGAELLNRDRFATQRQSERRAFATGANQLREENVMTRRNAAGNMATAGGNLFDAAGRVGMAGREVAGGLFDSAGRLRLAGTEVGGRLLDSAGQMRMDGREAAGRLFDAGGRMRMLGTTTAGDLRGMGAETTMRGQSLGGSLLADAGRLRQSGAGMMADLDPYARAINPGLALGQSAQSMGLGTIGQSNANMLDLFANTGSFNVNRNDSRYDAFMNNMTAVKTGQMSANAQKNAANISAAATRASRPSTFQTIVGGLSNLFGISDERLKTDIKPLGTAGSVLGLTAYEFRYKGDKKKRKGFMAQDVQKVLPDAVREFNHKDGKRLGILPQVIGQALAEELAANAKAA